jgi:hypothetical protein
MTDPIHINSLDELKRNLEIGEQADFIIVLNGGCFSRKEITRRGQDDWDIFHSIDGIFEELSSEGLLDPQNTNIAKAMEKRSFFKIL